MAKKQIEIHRTGENTALAIVPNCGTIEIEGMQFNAGDYAAAFEKIYADAAPDGQPARMGRFYVPLWGDRHNLYPQQVYALVSNNKLLPSIIKKQIDFLYGKGPILYREDIINGRVTRVPVFDADIQSWLDSWEAKGANNYRDYLRNLITDYYYVSTCCTEYKFNRSRVLGTPGAIDALQYIDVNDARLATVENPTARRIRNNDCNYVLVGDWLYPGRYEFSEYRRFDVANPYAHPHVIAFNAEKTFSKLVYSYNEWFEGLAEWIKASNLTPLYLNAYLQNAVNAHLHCKIPAAWCNTNAQRLENICGENNRLYNNNQQGIVTEYKGVKLCNDNGVPFRFSETMIDELIRVQLNQVADLMSGAGNGGKMYASVTVNGEGWTFEEMPQKFKEYFDSVLAYDKRSDQVILAGKGISSSITNVENDGVLSKSGSDVYYNYVIYLNTLTRDEEFICREINRAIALNFPYKAGVKMGFSISIPKKIQEIAPDDRIDAALNPTTAINDETAN